MQSIRNAIVAINAVALLASCGVAPQARVGGAGSDVPGHDKAARFHALSVTPVCFCNGAYGLGRDVDTASGVTYTTSFSLLEASAGNQGAVRVVVDGGGTFEAVDPPDFLSFDINGNVVTIEAVLKRIAGAGPDSLYAFVYADVSSRDYSLFIEIPGPVGPIRGKMATFGATPGSCDLPPLPSYPG